MSDYRDYMLVGVTHHLLCKFLAVSAKTHMDTLLPILEDERFDVFDLWIVSEEPYRTIEINAIKESRRKIVYNVGDREGNPIAYPTAIDKKVRSYSLDIFKQEIARGIEVGAKKIVTSSGPQHPDSTEDAFHALVDFYSDICDFVPQDTQILIEPTDTDFDKCFFIGSSQSSFELVKAVHANGYTNFASMIDMCHLPQLGETISQAYSDLGEYMQHVHLGTCVVDDPSNPFYGDKHPAWGVKGTNWAEKEIAELISLGLESGYFSKSTKGTASFEMVAYKDIPYLESFDRFFSYLERAWKLVPEELKR